MSKRFTETDKWRDPWFRNLSSQAKQLWLYLLDNCDKVGLIQIDLRLASTDCGQHINETHLAELSSRLEDCGNGKHLIPKFIHFQYGTLSESCKPHRSVIELVRLHGLVENGSVGYQYPTRTLQDKTRQDKRGVQGGKPTLEEVKLRGSTIALPDSECEKFFDYYESNGWRVGKNPMKVWTAALANWKRKWTPNGQATSNPVETREQETARILREAMG
jgi:hypothetical protein